MDEAQDPFAGAEVIYAYTRKDALADGVKKRRHAPPRLSTIRQTAMHIDFNHAAPQRARMPKKSKHPSPKPKGKKVAENATAPKPKSVATKSLAGGFVRLSETHMRKVYR